MLTLADIHKFIMSIQESNPRELGKSKLVERFLDFMDIKYNLDRKYFDGEFEKRKEKYNNFEDFIYEFYLNLEKDLRKSYEYYLNEAKERVKYYKLNFPTSIVGLMLDFLSKITAINGVLTLKQHLIFGIIRLRHPITSIEEVLIL